MGLFSKEETVFEQSDIRIGEVDYTNRTGTGYLNIVTFGFDVKRNRKLRVHVVSDNPVDVAIAYPNSSMAADKIQVTDEVVGPVDTKDSTDMGLIIAITPGDKATVSVKAWTDSK